MLKINHHLGNSDASRQKACEDLPDQSATVISPSGVPAETDHSLSTISICDCKASHSLKDLNESQRTAAEYGIGDCRPPAPLLIIAGAGTGKTKTLAHRVAYLVLNGIDPQRILLLTFTRRAAAEMTRRAARILGQTCGAPQKIGATVAVDKILWSGTFHAIANRLLRLHAHSIGLDSSFTVLDRSDAADLMNLVRNDMGLSKKEMRFPKKDTCLAIYSHTVNTCCELAVTLRYAFPWCADWPEELKELFRAYVIAKQRNNVLDYDDLLLYWRHVMEEPALAAQVAARFDHVLVDEYQDTNALQAAILLRMKSDGHGLAVVGDDAQSIYSFRAATVRNILDFPKHFSPPARIVTLEQNYRSTQPILDASNAVIGLAAEGHPKRLFSTKLGGEKPKLISASDESAQVDYVVDCVLEHREAGIDLKRQAILFRAAHHSAELEVELARRNIPFVKYGGLKFLEAAHVKDVLCALRWAENSRDAVAGFRVLQLLPGIGPSAARNVIGRLLESNFTLKALKGFSIPPAAAPHWSEFCDRMVELGESTTPWIGQVGLLRRWYQPYLERLYDHPVARVGDLEKLEQIAAGYATRERFLTEMTLDPPEATGAEAGAPLLDEDYLILSTIHSAKGQEWDTVFILNVTDGCIPSDMATGSPEQIEEERRVLGVAMTRAKFNLHLIQPLRFFRSQQNRYGDRYVFAPRSRFIPDAILDFFECRIWPQSAVDNLKAVESSVRADVAARMREMWR
ncbi:MAG: ATP-dependent helicase [Verrucomicrobia bacterium]|nr:ATP-dependent helicase [Verrucomicrobiota bacterium]